MVLLTIDAWRADFVAECEGVPLLPSLAARPTARLERLWANGPWTSPALVSALTGEHALLHDVHFPWSRPRPDSVGLATVFRAHGYRVPNICYLNRLDNFQHLGFSAENAPRRPDSANDPVIHDAIDQAATQLEPSFLWYHYTFVHMPYWAQDRFRRACGVEVVPDRLRQAVGVNSVAPRVEVTLDEDDAPMLRRMYAAGQDMRVPHHPPRRPLEIPTDA